MSQHTIVVPDIGDYTDVPVIEILVKPGDEITKEQALLVLESDKATMEVPSDQAGKVISVSVRITTGKFNLRNHRSFCNLIPNLHTHTNDLTSLI